MRVLQINSVCGTGSTGRIATDIHNTLIEQGHESFLAYGRNVPQGCSNALRIGSRFDNYVHAALTRIFDMHGFGSYIATKHFLKEVEKLKPDIIHLHNLHGYYINIELLFKYLKKINLPVVWTLHDCWAFTGHCAHFDFVGCDKWLTNCFQCPNKRCYPASLMIDNSSNNYQRKADAFTRVNNLTIVTPSNWLANLVRKSFLKDYSIEVINNGIDLEVFKPTKNIFRSKYKLENKYIILGVANVWNERKGYQYFLELSNLINSDEIIVMVGVSKKQLDKLPSNIIGISLTNSIRELADIYSAADVFVNPTLEEVMGLTNVEALACGTPVITFNSGGSPECIDESCGLVVEKGNSEKLQQAISLFKAKGKAFYSINCINRAHAYFNSSDRNSDYFNLYRSLVLSVSK